jgi:hypothetical protein
MNTKPLGKLMTEYETELVEKYKYEIDLNPREQRVALVELADSVMRSANNIKKHRTMRQSEKAMALSSLLMKTTALQMAIDRLDKEVITELGEKVMAKSHSVDIGNS